MNTTVRLKPENDECLSVLLLAGNNAQTSTPQAQTNLFESAGGFPLSLARRYFRASSNVSYRLLAHFQNAPEARWIEI